MAADDELDALLLSVLETYREQVDQYDAFARVVADRLCAASQAAWIHVEVSARAKDPAHLVIKLQRKIAEKPDEYLPDPLARVTDLAGARVVVDHRHDVERLLVAIRGAFDVTEEDDKAAEVRPNELGYTGYHLQVRLPADAPEAETLGALQCEVQVHTIAQHAWSAVSHPLIYKPAGGSVDRSVEARVYRSVALVSLFDDEVMVARNQLQADPAHFPARMLDVLDKIALGWRRLPDRSGAEDSLEVLTVLAETYEPDEVDHYEGRMMEFMAAHRDELAATQKIYAELGTPHGLLFAPEVAAILERRVNRPAKLRAAWVNSRLPIALLDETLTALGRPYGG